MREASSKRDCLCVRMYVCHTFFTNFFLREKVHIVSARHISTLLCVEMTMCLKFWDIVSARVIFTFSDVDSKGDMLSHALTHIHSPTHTHTHTHTYRVSEDNSTLESTYPLKHFLVGVLHRYRDNSTRSVKYTWFVRNFCPVWLDNSTKFFKVMLSCSFPMNFIIND